MDNAILLGDFNSITDSADRLSSKLDGTSNELIRIQRDCGLCKPNGSQTSTFTYHHPSNPAWKSRINHISMTNHAPSYCGYAQYI